MLRRSFVKSPRECAPNPDPAADDGRWPDFRIRCDLPHVEIIINIGDIGDNDPYNIEYWG